jgi:hypothetical protein
VGGAGAAVITVVRLGGTTTVSPSAVIAVMNTLQKAIPAVVMVAVFIMQILTSQTKGIFERDCVATAFAFMNRKPNHRSWRLYKSVIYGYNSPAGIWCEQSAIVSELHRRQCLQSTALAALTI